MTFPNHVAGGLVFTGIFSSISGINIFTNPWYLGMAIFSSLLPDVDTPKSPIGRLFLPIARWLNRVHGHRTLTHSFLFLGVSMLLIGIPEKLLFDSSSYTVIFFYGFLSHLILDMVTKSGVYCFYPWIRHRPAVIPGDENLRISTRNRKAEITVFGFFCLTAWFLAPLFQNGFWTSYNRFFGTLQHLGSEFRKSEDLLKVDYTYRIGSEVFQDHGYCIHAESSKAILMKDDGTFQEINKKDMVILSILPEHTGRKYTFENQYFIGIDADSLNRLLKDQFIVHLEVEANDKFLVYRDRVGEETQRFSGDYLTNIQIREIDKELPVDTFTQMANPRIETLRQKMRLLEEEDERVLLGYERQQAELKELEQLVLAENDLYQKEKMQERIRELRVVKVPILNTVRIGELGAQVRELERGDYLERLGRDREKVKLLEEMAKKQLEFIGLVKVIRMNNE